MKKKAKTPTDMAPLSGTTEEMVVQRLPVLISEIPGYKDFRDDGQAVLCKDDKGFFITINAYIGNHLLDPFRQSPWLPKV